MMKKMKNERVCKNVRKRREREREREKKEERREIRVTKKECVKRNREK